MDFSLSHRREFDHEMEHIGVRLECFLCRVLPFLYFLKVVEIVRTYPLWHDLWRPSRVRNVGQSHRLTLGHRVGSLTEVLLDRLYGSKSLSFTEHRLFLSLWSVVCLNAYSTRKDDTDLIKMASCLLQLLASLLDTVLASGLLGAWTWAAVLWQIC